jgi:subtilisin family serine protease
MKRLLSGWLLVGTLISVFLSCTKQELQNEALLSSLQTDQPGKAPLLKADATAQVIRGSYFVIFQDDVRNVDEMVTQITNSHNITARYVYRHTVKGFAASLPDAAIEALRNNPRVKYLEEDQLVSVVGVQTSPPSWGLDRVDQVSLPLDASYTYSTDGSTVDAYIFDTGIFYSHTDFGGRAIFGYDAFGGIGLDRHSHGTHVSGTVGGTSFGLAKNIRLIAVKVLGDNGSGSWTGIAAGLDWAVGHHAADKKAVGNMSLGGGASTTVDQAVKRAVADGIVMCLAAGNEQIDAGTRSPARVTEAITVGSTASNDSWSYFSNYGSVVDILAPGSSIVSCAITSTTASSTKSGTSMATPHVCGASALYLEAGYAPAEVEAALKAKASANKISGVPAGTVNLLLYSRAATVTPSAPDQPVLSTPANNATLVTLNPVLSWNSSYSATSYSLQVSTDQGFNTPLVDAQNLTTTSYNLTSLAENTTYYWRVNAENSIGTSAWSSTWTFTTTPPVVTLDVPILSAPANGANNIPIPTPLKWNAVTNATSYNVQVSTNSGFTKGTKLITGINSTNVNVSGLKRNTVYYWRVQAVNATNTSAYSEPRSFTTVAR